MATETFSVPNISCGHCVMTIERELGELEGVSSVEANAVHNDLRFQKSPLGTAFLFTGVAALAGGLAVGSIGVHKLRLRADSEILDTASMDELKDRRTKVHHFSPDDFYYDIYSAPTIRRKMSTEGGKYSMAPVVGDRLIGVGFHATF